MILPRALVSQGSPFQTVLRMTPFTVATPVYGIPRLRLSTFKFGPADYQTYCLQRADILRNPRIARQALMRGGIIWRLAMDNASFQDVLAGPTAVATAKHQCMSWVSESGTFYVDDILPSHEADVILGVYNVYTGKIWQYLQCINFNLPSVISQGTQMATKSYWPPVELWDALVRQPFWHKRSETWFENRLKDLESGQGMPLTNTQWRARLKINSVVRRATNNNIEVSKAYLQDLQK